MLRNYLTLLLFLHFISISWAQTGNIKGKVTDSGSGEAVVGANVYNLADPNQGTIVDINGDFEFQKVKSGTYTLIISFISFKTDTIRNITVYPDQTTLVEAKMSEDVVKLTELVVNGNKITNTDIAVITELKKSDLVATGISAQQISLSQDRDAAQVIRRVPGVTILNDKFINVRGLNERYNMVLLNGVEAPSTEVDSRAFAFDLVPSGMIDRMLVYKSGSPDLPGEFAGAVIDIQTKNIVEDNSFSVEYTFSARQGTTFKKFNGYRGSSTDWLGYDHGTRQLPATFPGENLSSIDISTQQGRDELINASKSLPNNWQVKSNKAIPDSRLAINFSRVIRLGKMKLSNITSINYTRTSQHSMVSSYYYDVYVPANHKSNRRYYYLDSRDAVNARLGFISNFVLELNPDNRIEFRNLFNQQGLSETTLRTGDEDLQGSLVNNEALNYQQRGIYSGQLSGKHSFGNHLNLNWIIGYSRINSKQPDYRRIRSQKSDRSPNDPWAIVIPPTSSTFDAGRYYSNMEEQVYTHALNLSWKINPDADEGKSGKIIAGYYLARTDRDFAARWMAYKWATLDNRPINILVNSTFNNIFNPENIGYSFEFGKPPYFILDEGTNPSDKYRAENLLAAGYTGITTPLFVHFRLSAGVRIEYNHQKLNSYLTNGNPTNVDNPVTSPLPFLNLSYNYTDKSLVRIAYSKTVNRPIFRELAGFTFYDFDRNADTYGNPDLKTADIHNLDLRWENYPSNSEIISVGAFYKYFLNPIENLNVGGSNQVYSFVQATSAYCLGSEIEIRKSLAGISNIPIINKFSVLLNAAFIKSQVNLGTSDTILALNQLLKRPLQGQSPYVLNAGLYYNDPDKGWQFNISYNVFGKRIYAVGDERDNSTQYEMPRGLLDFTLSKNIRSHWQIKFGIQNILDKPYRLLQDSDKNEKITKVDEPIVTYKTGQYVSVGIIYKL